MNKDEDFRDVTAEVNAPKTEHEHMENIARMLDRSADDLFQRIANDEFTDEGKPDADREAQAYRRCAEIVRYQMECES